MFEDTTFHQSIRNVQREPVPYFAQLKPFPTPTPREQTQLQDNKEEEEGEMSRSPPGSAGAVIGGDMEAALKEDYSAKFGQRGRTDLSSVTKAEGGLKHEQTDVSFYLHKKEETTSPKESPDQSQRSSTKQQKQQQQQQQASNLNLTQEYSGILKPEDTFFSDFGGGGGKNNKATGISFSQQQHLRSPSVQSQTGEERRVQEGMADAEGEVVYAEGAGVVSVHMPVTPELREMERNNRMMELMRGDAEVSFCAEKALENCLSNIMNEAVAHTFNPVMKPRLIADAMHKPDQLQPSSSR